MKLLKLFSRKPKWADKHIDYKLIKVFEHGSHVYYKFPKETNLPLERFSKAMELLERLSSGISGDELDAILDAMDQAISAGLSNPKNASALAGMVHVMREKKANVIHRDLMLNIAATFIIREDENPAVLNPDIHQQKLDTFEAISKEGSHDFFTRLGIEPLMPLLTMSPGDFKLLWDYNIQAQRQLTEALEQLTSHLTTGQKQSKKS